MRNQVIEQCRIGIVTGNEKECLLMTCYNNEKKEQVMQSFSKEEQSKNDFHFMFIRTESQMWKKILGCFLQKKRAFVIDPKQMVNFVDYSWLGRFIEKNRLDVSFENSLRYSAFAVKIKEWIMTNYLNNPEIEIELPFQENLWQWVDLGYWWSEGGKISICEQNVTIFSEKGSCKIKKTKKFSLKIKDGQKEHTLSEDLQVLTLDSAFQRCITLPKEDKMAVEYGCRCHEIFFNQVWVVYPVRDMLFWLKNQDIFRQLITM